jgi:hypothetical protein
MKKFSLVVLAVILVFAFTAPAFAFESSFGGYWRTRAFIQENFNGESNGLSDVSRVDTRTRLYYFADFSENFRFVNKFEMNAVWGSDSDYGDIGADGLSVRVKNTYADFTMGDFNFKVGTQGKVIARGMVFDDDFSGVIARYVSDEMIFPFIWINANEGGTGPDRTNQDVDYYVLDPRFLVGESTWINPFAMYIYSQDASAWAATTANEDVKVYLLGVNVDMDLDIASVWFTGIYEGGEVDTIFGDSLDLKAYLVAGGASANVGEFEIHGELFYASGDDDPADSDVENFFIPDGQSYYWSEIMGIGVFDNQASAGSPADALTNIWAANIGATMEPMEKMKVTLDLWYAAHAEDDVTTDEKKLGTEVDLKVTYNLLENLNLEVVGAYLFADDATATDSDGNDDDPFEVGTRLSFSF